MKFAAVVFSCLLGALGAVCACAARAEDAKVQPKPDLVKGLAKATAVCSACHADDGNRGSPAYPILQGQHPEYLVKQLTEFKAGKRVNAIMQGMAAILTPDDMRDVAAFYASKQAKPGFAKDKALATAGEKIYRGGIADRSIPACAGCHGPSGAGIPVQYPRLAGQHSDYILAQLTAFRGGVRNNSAAMTGVAAKLNDNDIKALSEFITGLR